MQRCPATAMRAAAMEESERGVIGARGCRLRDGIGDRPAGRRAALAYTTRRLRGALVCAVCRCGALPRGTGPSAAGMRGRKVEPSAASDTGYGANCAARALMNPFTPTFPRYGAVIEINCYVTINSFRINPLVKK